MVSGDYYATCDFSSLQQASIKRDGSGATPDLARLQGARIVTASEPKKGTVLDTGFLKSITGGDPIVARHLHRAAIEFLPQFKLWMFCNDAPRIVGDDDAMWNRVLRVSFDHRYREMNLARKDRLVDPGITGPAALTWAVRGSVLYHSDALKISPKVLAYTSEYRQQQDPLADFYAEYCVFREDASWETGDLHLAYRQWAEAEHLPESKIMRRRQLVEHLKRFKKCIPRQVRGKRDIQVLDRIGKLADEWGLADAVPMLGENQARF
jgi:putative DNA primase/helicase